MQGASSTTSQFTAVTNPQGPVGHKSSRSSGSLVSPGVSNAHLLHSLAGYVSVSAGPRSTSACSGRARLRACSHSSGPLTPLRLAVQGYAGLQPAASLQTSHSEPAADLLAMSQRLLANSSAAGEALPTARLQQEVHCFAANAALSYHVSRICTCMLSEACPLTGHLQLTPELSLADARAVLQAPWGCRVRASQQASRLVQCHLWRHHSSSRCSISLTAVLGLGSCTMHCTKARAGCAIWRGSP